MGATTDHSHIVDHLVHESYNATATYAVAAHGLWSSVWVPTTQSAALDDLCMFGERMPSEIDLGSRALQGLLQEREVRKLFERKYIAKTESVKPVLLPYCHLRIDSSDGSKSRELLLDGVTGKALAL